MEETELNFDGLNKLCRLTKVGYFTGIIIILAAVLRYFVIWIDYSQALIMTAIGILVWIVSFLFQKSIYLYKQIRKLQNSLDYIEERLQDKFEQINELLEIPAKLLNAKI